MVKIIKINESFLKIICPYDIALELSDEFAFFVEGYRWSPKYESGVWDGKIRLFNIKSSLLPIGLYNDVKKYFYNNYIEYQDKVKINLGVNISIEKINDFSQNILKCENKMTGDYHFQAVAVQQALKHTKLILKSATGSGKCIGGDSEIEVELSDDMYEKYMKLLARTGRK